MKAKELIEELVKLVDEHGDMEVVIATDNGYFTAIDHMYPAEPDVFMLCPPL